MYDLDNYTSYVVDNTTYDYFRKFMYDNSNVVSGIENVWERGYNVIANANNIIQNIKNTTPDLFKQGKMERDLILGEALACRAFMHFDLLRLFAPAPVNDDGQAYIPYVTTYPSLYAQKMTVQAVLDSIINDLEKARPMVVAWDTSSMGRGTLTEGISRFHNEFIFDTDIYSSPDASKVEEFFKGRGYRMHYFAMTAALARAYAYKGDYQKAYDCAKEIMNFKVVTFDERSGFPCFARDNYNGAAGDWDTKTDLKTLSNLIFGVYQKEAVAHYSLSSYFHQNADASSANWFALNVEGQKIFYTRSGVNEYDLDYRGFRLIALMKGAIYISGKYYPSSNETIAEENAQVVPLIRSSEMRYIMAEYFARNNNFEEAAKILNDMRAARGCQEVINISNWNDFQAELIQDARREYIGEGQLFFLYKRLDAAIDFGANKETRKLTRSEYLWPIPTNEGL